MLLYAIGNVGRQDDGLGWAFADEVEKTSHNFDEIIRNYQMNIEDAELFSRHENILIVDASKDEKVEDFNLQKIQAADGIKPSFTTHLLSASEVINLCKQVYGKEPNVHLLEIKGYEWELKMGMTLMAERNLINAFCFWRENA